METPVTKRVGEWMITVQPQRDPVFKWRATATKSVHYEAASGMDLENALTGIADKIGLSAADLLAAFTVH